MHNYDITCLDILKDNSKFCTGGGDKIIMVTDVLQGIFVFIQENKSENIQVIMAELTALVMGLIRILSYVHYFLITFRLAAAMILPSSVGTTDQTRICPSRPWKGLRILFPK